MAAMDVGKLLRQARDTAGVSQTALAEAAGSSRSAVCAYEGGSKSPSVRTLDRLLAAAGLQARVTLEPLLADLDERVDALMAAQPSVDVERLVHAVDGLRPTDEESITWAFDGATALNLHGIGADEEDRVWAVLVFDGPARRWMSRRMVKGLQGRGAVGWNSVDIDGARHVLGTLALAPFGLARLRLVEALPATVQLELASGQPVCVVTVDEVEQGFPEHAELLGRWRERRTVGR
jgi:transcriptional regulator with XRE-family HTH domain